MLRPWLGLFLTGILCALSLPFFVISISIAALCAVPAALGAPFHRPPSDSSIRKTWRSNEFAFERAIEAYEELIDAHAWRQP